MPKYITNTIKLSLVWMALLTSAAYAEPNKNIECPASTPTDQFIGSRILMQDDSRTLASAECYYENLEDKSVSTAHPNSGNYGAPTERYFVITEKDRERLTNPSSVWLGIKVAGFSYYCGRSDLRQLAGKAPNSAKGCELISEIKSPPAKPTKPMKELTPANAYKILFSASSGSSVPLNAPMYVQCFDSRQVAVDCNNRERFIEISRQITPVYLDKTNVSKINVFVMDNQNAVGRPLSNPKKIFDANDPQKSCSGLTIEQLRSAEIGVQFNWVPVDSAEGVQYANCQLM